MRTMFLSAVFSIVLLVPATAMAAASMPAQEVNAQPQVQKVKETLICRAPIHEGMLLTHAKQCYTREEWDARQHRMQESIHEAQMRNLLQHN